MPLGSNRWRRKLWRSPHVGCRRCKAKAESLRQKDRGNTDADILISFQSCRFAATFCFDQKQIFWRYIFMKAVISVTGKDGVGIVAKVSVKCAECGANIIDISQTVLDEYFAMIMIADISALNMTFGDFVDHMAVIGKESGLQIHTMHEDIFKSMHKI